MTRVAFYGRCGRMALVVPGLLLALASSAQTGTSGNSAPYFYATKATIGACGNITNYVSGSVPAVDKDPGQTITWSIASQPVHGTAAASFSTTSTGSRLDPAGIQYTPAHNYSGPDVMSVRVTDGFLADTITLYITVTAAPAIAEISGPTSVCEGDKITLSSSVTGGKWSTENNVALVSADGVVTGRIGDNNNIVYYTTATRCGTHISAHKIRINKVPSPYPIWGKSAIAPGSSEIMSDMTPGGRWSTSDAGIANVDAAGRVTGLTNGTAVISYTVSNACGSSSRRKTVNITTNRSIKEPGTGLQTAGGHFKIYPNPNQGLFTLELPVGTSSANITISDASGKVVTNISTTNSREAFNVQNWAKGIYIISVLANGNQMQEKLVVE